MTEKVLGEIAFELISGATSALTNAQADGLINEYSNLGIEFKKAIRNDNICIISKAPAYEYELFREKLSNDWKGIKERVGHGLLTSIANSYRPGETSFIPDENWQNVIDFINNNYMKESNQTTLKTEESNNKFAGNDLTDDNTIGEVQYQIPYNSCVCCKTSLKNADRTNEYSLCLECASLSDLMRACKADPLQASLAHFFIPFSVFISSGILAAYLSSWLIFILGLIATPFSFIKYSSYLRSIGIDMSTKNIQGRDSLKKESISSKAEEEVRKILRILETPEEWCNRLVRLRDYSSLASYLCKYPQNLPDDVDTWNLKICAARTALEKAGSEAVDDILAALEKGESKDSDLAEILVRIGDRRAVSLLKKYNDQGVWECYAGVQDDISQFVK